MNRTLVAIGVCWISALAVRWALMPSDGEDSDKSAHEWRDLAVAVRHADPTGAPPPPYTDPNLSITNALGGIGRTEGYQKSVTSAAGLDMVLGLTAVAGDLNTAIKIAPIRVVTITLISQPTANGALCARLGPDDNLGTDPAGTPTLTCPDTNAAGGVNGGCYLWNSGQSCTFTIRPTSTCNGTIADCHIPLWALASATAADVKVATSVAW